MELCRLIFSVLLISYNALLVKACFALPILSKVNDKFSRDLFKILARKEGNLLYSPISTHAILSLMYEEAAGDTARSMGKVLNTNTKLSPHYNSAINFMRSLKNITLHIGNKVFVQRGYKLSRDFKYIAQTDYYAKIAKVNFMERFPTASLINGWIERETNGTITDLISPYDLYPPPQLLLVNTICLDSDWLHKFNKRYTKRQKFYLSGGRTVKCKMMQTRGVWAYHEDRQLNAQVLSLPYKNDNFSLLVILPKKRDGIKHVERKLQTLSFTDIHDRLEHTHVHLSLPKFQIKSKIQLKDPLIEMGMGIAFSSAADFSNMLVSKKEFRISKIVQKTLIDIHESGSGAEASAVISRAREELFDRTKFVTFKANHPFIFAVTLDLGELLPIFVGKLKKP